MQQYRCHAGRKWHDCYFPGNMLDGTIIRLPVTKVRHWNLDALIGFAPYIATCIIPKQMTLVQIQDHNLTSCYRCSPVLKELTDLFFFAATRAGSWRGFARCAFF